MLLTTKVNSAACTAKLNHTIDLAVSHSAARASDPGSLIIIREKQIGRAREIRDST
jgi:hypothetical protein